MDILEKSGSPISRPRSCRSTESGIGDQVRACLLGAEPNRKWKRRVFMDKPIFDVQCCHLKVYRKVPHEIVVLVDIAEDQC
jgi:hypothetical protein